MSMKDAPLQRGVYSARSGAPPALNEGNFEGSFSGEIKVTRMLTDTPIRIGIPLEAQ
jgi:hypothetical protein